MKAAKALLAIALASQLLLACSKEATNSNANNSNNSNNANSKTTTTTTTTTNTTSKATSNTEAPAGGQTASSDSGDNHYTHKEGGIQFDVPAGWKATPDGDNITLSTADNSLNVVMYVASEDNFNEATEALDKELGKTIKNVKTTTEPKETQVGGMKSVTSSGTGEVNGNEIQWAVDLIQAKRPVIVLTFAAPGVWEKHQGEYQQFGKSIKPA